MDLKSIKNIAGQCLAEFFASAMLLSMGCLCIADPISRTLMIGISFGLTVMVCIQCFGCISGGHINPCVTVAAVIFGETKYYMGILFVIFQFLGAFLGYYLALNLTPLYKLPNIRYFCITRPHSLITTSNAFALEVIFTATWIFSMCAIWDKRNKKNQESTAMRIGLIITAISVGGEYFTGASMNPARTLAPAIFMEFYEKIWIYLTAPIIPAIVIPLVWKYLYAESEESNEEQSDPA